MMTQLTNCSKLSDDPRIGRETDGYNENCLGVRFALCMMTQLQNFAALKIKICQNL